MARKQAAILANPNIRLLPRKPLLPLIRWPLNLYKPTCFGVNVELEAKKPGFSTAEVPSSYEKPCLTDTIGSMMAQKTRFLDTPLNAHVLEKKAPIGTQILCTFAEIMQMTGGTCVEYMPFIPYFNMRIVPFKNGSFVPLENGLHNRCARRRHVRYYPQGLFLSSSLVGNPKRGGHYYASFHSRCGSRGARGSPTAPSPGTGSAGGWHSGRGKRVGGSSRTISARCLAPRLASTRSISQGVARRSMCAGAAAKDHRPCRPARGGERGHGCRCRCVCRQV
jgi:hypothetical protein